MNGSTLTMRGGEGGLRALLAISAPERRALVAGGLLALAAAAAYLAQLRAPRRAGGRRR